MASITVSDGVKRPAPVDDDPRHDDPFAASARRNGDVSQPKRRRVADDVRIRSAKACQRCRRLKEKCDGQHPCQRCTKSGKNCEFAPAGSSAPASTVAKSTSPPTRTRRPETSSSGFSAGEGGVMAAERARSEERTRCLERLVQHLLGDVPMDLNNLRRMAEKASQRTGTGSVGNGVRAGTEDLDDLTLEDENFTVKTLSQSTAHYSGEFSHWNFSQKLRRRLSQCLDSDVARPSMKKELHNPPSSMPPPASRGIPPNRAGMRILEYWRATQLQSPKTLVQSVLSCLPPRAVSSFLVRIYFQFAQVNSFYAEEDWLRNKLDFLYEAPGHVTSEDSAWVCSVLLVLAIGTQFAHMAAGSPEARDDNEGGGASGFASGADSDVGVTFYQMASKLIPDVITIASMESVQACLLLAHYALPLDTQGLAYTYLGLGMKMAIQNGMHRRYAGADLDAWTVETRNRLWWSAYTLERRVSVLHGRPASIAPTEMDAELPKDLPEFRKHDDTSKFGNMSALIDMTIRLSDVSNAITLLRRCPKNLQPTYFERIVDICQSLRTWWSTLPADVQDPTPCSPLFRSNAHLKLTLHLNEIFVGRPFILSSSTGASPGSMSSPGCGVRRFETSSSSSEPGGDISRPRSRAALALRAVEAAISITSLLSTLDETTGLARCGYTEFSSCRAALLVMLAQSVAANGTQTAELRAAIELGMRLIRKMAAGNVSTRSETSVIEALETAVRRLVEMQLLQLQQQAEGAHGADTSRSGDSAVDLELDDGVEGRAEGDAAKTGYERFREWASLWPAAGGEAGEELGRSHGRVTPGFAFAELTAAPSSLAGAGRAAPPLQRAGAATEEHSPESARWLSTVDTGEMGLGMDDLGLFGGFPEFGALDGWPGLG